MVPGRFHAAASLVALFALAACEPEPGTVRGGPDAGEVHDPATPPPSVVGVIGQPCPWPGWLGCSGIAQKGLLVCDENRIWRTNGVCYGDTNCDTTFGPRAGSCQPILRECYGSYVKCDGDDRVTCNADRVGFVRTRCPAGCVDRECVECRVGDSVCVGRDIRICTYAHEWRIELCKNGPCVDDKCP